MTLETITLEQMIQSYRRLAAEYQAGRLTFEQYTASLANLQGVDAVGRWWAVRPDGKFWMHNGVQWIPATPPGMSAPAGRSRPAGSQAPNRMPPSQAGSAAVAAPARGRAGGIQVPRPVQAMANRGSALLKAAPILAVAPSLVCGGLWFLYTFLGLFKSEGIVGVDWLTPIIIGIVPVGLWIFKKQVDTLLLPLKPMVTSLAKPLRLGIVLGVPVLMGCMCATLTPSGYLGLNVSSMLSVLAAAILMRY